MFTILIVLLVVTVAQAATGPGDYICEVTDEVTLPRDDGPITKILSCEFTCDLVSYHQENYEDGSYTVFRIFYCNEYAADRADTCVLWRTTTTEADSSDGETITYWYMCNLFSTYLPVISR